MSGDQKRWPPHIRKLEPTRAWEVLSVREEARPLPLGPLQQPGPQPPGTVRFVCVSDTHSTPPRQPLPAGDCLIHAGDFTDTGRPKELEAFCAWLKAQPHARKIVIAGNHDLTLDPESYPRTQCRFGHKQPHDCAAARALIEGAAEYLHDSGTSVGGLLVWGSPWQPEHMRMVHMQCTCTCSIYAVYTPCICRCGARRGSRSSAAGPSTCGAARRVRPSGASSRPPPTCW